MTRARTNGTSTSPPDVGILNNTNGLQGQPIIGKAKDGRIVLYDQEAYNDQTIWVRFTMFPINAKEARSEQAFSSDAGKTWETNWINHYSLNDPKDAKRD